MYEYGFRPLAAAAAILTLAGVARAQTPAAPPAPPKIWTANASAGLTLTSGNTDTSTINAGYGIVYDPHQSNVVKSDALLLYGRTNGVATADRFDWNGRDEYKLTPHVAVFGATEYLRDTFKDIGYLVAPTGGVSYSAGTEKTTYIEVSGGAGGVWEKDTGLPVQGSGSVTADQKFTQALTPTATVDEAASALWKTSDFGDALYVFSAGVTASMSAHTQIKVDLLDTFKNKPPEATLKNDVTLVVAFVFKT